MDNASLRDFNKGEGTYVADALERSLLLPADMADLKNLRRQELFLSMKRYLGMVRFQHLWLCWPLFPGYQFTPCLFLLVGRPGHL